MWCSTVLQRASRKLRIVDLSLGQVPDGDTALVRSSRPLQDAPCPLHPLTQPVPAWLASHHKLVIPTEPAD